jgi:hypothetical protein
VHYPYAGLGIDGGDGDGVDRSAPTSIARIQREEIWGIRLGFSPRKKRIGLLNACVTIVACKISVDFRANSTLTARRKQMHFALRIKRRPEIQLGSSGGSQERFEKF